MKRRQQHFYGMLYSSESFFGELATTRLEALPFGFCRSQVQREVGDCRGVRSLYLSRKKGVPGLLGGDNADSDNDFGRFCGPYVYPLALHTKDENGEGDAGGGR